MTAIANSEEFTANVRAKSRAKAFSIFIGMAADYFGVTPERLIVKCYGAGVDEVVTRDDVTVVTMYDVSFGSVIRVEEP